MTPSIRVRSTSAAEAFVVALEELTFLPVEYVPYEPSEPLDEPMFCARIAAEGVGVASLAIVVPKKLLLTVTSTALGLDEADISDDMLRDAAGEMVNTTCGGLVRTLANGDPFKLGLPEVGCGGTAMKGPTISRERFAVDGVRMDLLVEWA